MNAARLFTIGGSLLLLNAVAVLTSGVWRHVLADEPLRPGQATELAVQPTVEPAEDSVDTPRDSRVDQPANAPTQEQPTQEQPTQEQPTQEQPTQEQPTQEQPAKKGPSQASATASPLDRIPIPDSLPTVPSLADHESLKDDPGFQEFSRLFSKVEESWETDYPTSVKPRAKLHSGDYFDALDKRLHSAEQLCAVARSIAAEAARQSLNGRSKQSEELLQMATQLRDMAAKLLIVEL